MSADIIVVVVTYNSMAHIDGLLDSLRRELAGVDAEVIVVDNDSSDGTAARVAARPDARLLRSSNRGYAAAINAAVESTTSRAPLFILNPDTRLEPGTINAVLAAVTRHHAIIAPRILNDDGTLVDSLRRAPTLRRALGLGFTGWPAFTEHIPVTEPVYTLGGEADWATGAALVIPRECHDAVGGWDESYFLYSEETDFCLRARAAGWPTRLEPRAVVRHTGGGSGFRPDLYALQILNRVRLFRRRTNRWAGAAYFTLAVAREGYRALRGDSDSRHAVRSLLWPPGRPFLPELRRHLIPR